MKSFRITSKFIVWFLFISLLPLSIATYISYNSSRKILEEEIRNSLLVVADNKANQVEAFLQRKKNDAVTLSSMSGVLEAMDKLDSAFHNFAKDSAEYSAVEQEFIPMLAYYQRSFGYDDIILTSVDGDVLFSIKGSKNFKSLYEIALQKKSELADVFIKTKSSQEVEVSGFEYYPQAKEVSVFIAAPVIKESSPSGFIILQMSNKGLYEFVQDYTGLGSTGETILASKMEDEAVFIAPLRFDPDAAFKRRVRLGAEERKDIQKAVQEEKGLGISIDYRNQETLAVWRYLPAFRLGMVVKMDTEEIFASAQKLRSALLKISFILLVLVVFVAIALARSISSPIKDLTRVSKVISEGELSARAKIITNDEIGELATSFNQMTDNLVEAKANVEQKKAEVEEQKRLLEEANKELDSFVYTVSHDLRAPLRGITGLVNFLDEDYADKLDSEGKGYLNKIRTGAFRMNKLINDLLELSRISRIKNPYEDVNMRELINSVTGRIEFDIKELKVEMIIADNLPVVRCDRIKMEEAFLNLINNAIKFSSKNKAVSPRVEIGYNEREDTYEFYVRDNGIGVDKKYHKEIFGIFKRLHTQEEYEGTGAGLSIVKRIIDDHKGSIWLDSELGKGATFYFTIPKKLPEKKKLGQILIEEGHISEEDLKKALEKQVQEEA